LYELENTDKKRQNLTVFVMPFRKFFNGIGIGKPLGTRIFCVSAGMVQNKHGTALGHGKIKPDRLRQGCFCAYIQGSIRGNGAGAGGLGNNEGGYPKNGTKSKSRRRSKFRRRQIIVMEAKGSRHLT
jgi:hypothetical protein